MLVGSKKRKKLEYSTPAPPLPPAEKRKKLEYSTPAPAPLPPGHWLYKSKRNAPVFLPIVAANITNFFFGK